MKSCLESSNLLSKLLMRRSSEEENRLSQIVRRLSSDKKVGIIEILSKKNVRLAAAIAARANLSIDQQSVLFAKILKREQSNEIRQYVDRLFAHRLGMGRTRILKILIKYEDSNPKGVYFAAYYLGSGDSLSALNKKRVVELFERAKIKALGQ
ncbi:hypothetical protein [Achromobacter ruhlandii]|uniref:hypothetical protein n=1 Tax=Achromobacter ruhlandii TaxID=72557 RepID=UPI003BA17EB9